jgi:hypothetical protein
MNKRTSPQKTWWRLGAVALVVLLISLVAWDVYERFAKNTAPPDVEEASHIGPASTGDSGGTSSLKAPYWMKGKRLVLSGYAEYPGRPYGPAYLILLRKTDPQKKHWATQVGTGGSSKVHLHVEFEASKGQPFWLKSDLGLGQVIEQVRLGETSYPLEDGRLFLVDLGTLPVSVTQLKVDIANLLPKEDAKKDDLAKAVQQLQDGNETVRQFWLAE